MAFTDRMARVVANSQAVPGLPGYQRGHLIESQKTIPPSETQQGTNSESEGRGPGLVDKV